MPDDIQLLLTLAAGTSILLFGRRLFWLYVGIVGFLIGYEAALTYLASEPYWLHLLVGVSVGLVGALISILVQYVAIAIGGFMGGAYLASKFLQYATMLDLEGWKSLIVGVAGILGVVMLLISFDTILVLLSALTGAALLVSILDLEPFLRLGVFVALAITGILFQLTVLTSGRRK
jgi:hypothetical protein